jgi:hypothetical protein
MKTLRLISLAINPVINSRIGFVGDTHVLATDSLLRERLLQLLPYRFALSDVDGGKERRQILVISWP